MRYKLISCDVFVREVCLAIANSSNTIDPEFTTKGAHENPNELNKLLQQKIDEADASGLYDAILLCYGLCGNSTIGLKAGSIPVVMPRAHDCCTIFLGSRHKFIEYFKDNLSAQWSSAGYAERGGSYLRDTDTGKLLGIDKGYNELVEKYGEENAEYIWETLHPKNENKSLIYIEIPETAGTCFYAKCEEEAAKEGKSIQLLKGDMRLIRGLLDGKWNEDEYLIIAPGQIVKPVYDDEVIITV